jgi:hypothetical protein
VRTAQARTTPSFPMTRPLEPGVIGSVAVRERPTVLDREELGSLFGPAVYGKGLHRRAGSGTPPEGAPIHRAPVAHGHRNQPEPVESCLGVVPTPRIRWSSGQRCSRTGVIDDSP